MTSSVKQLENKVRTLEAENTLLKTSTEQLMFKFANREAMVTKSAHKLVKRMPAQFAGIAVCSNQAISGWCAREDSELQHFEHRCRRNWADWSEPTIGSKIKLADGVWVVPSIRFR